MTMNPLQPPQPYCDGGSLSVIKEKKHWSGELLPTKDPWIYLPILHPQEKQILMSPPMLSLASK